MSGFLKVPPSGFEELTVAVPEWHRQILDERLAESERDPDEGVPWEEFRIELLRETAPKRRQTE